MRLVIMLVYLLIPLLMGCNGLPEHQETLQAVVRMGQVHLETSYMIEKTKCEEEGLLDCPKADFYSKLNDKALYLIAVLEEPLPPTGPQQIFLAMDMVIEEMEREGADIELIMYAKEIKIILELMFSS
jgi:hypothetical protein